MTVGRRIDTRRDFAVQNVFEAETADELWKALTARFRRAHAVRDQTSRAGVTRELLHAFLVQKKPRERWVYSRMPPINPEFAIAEVVWILAGRHDSSFLNYFNRVLPKFAGSGTTYHGA